MKITKEQAREIYNHYSQIEACEGLIADLKKAIEIEKGAAPDILRDPNYHPHGSITINIPYFDNTSSMFQKEKGSRVYNISYTSAVRVLKNHLKHLKRELAELQKEKL